jgi:hypothetical protein
LRRRESKSGPEGKARTRVAADLLALKDGVYIASTFTVSAESGTLHE